MGDWFVLFETDEDVFAVLDYNDEGVELSSLLENAKSFEVFELYDFIEQAHEHLDNETCKRFILLRMGI